jgi:Fe-Mn family superoxide dismutase
MLKQEIAPIAVRPWTLNGMSERLIVSHYENNYGGAVRTLNAVRRELAALEAGAPAFRVRALKREELLTMNSVALHELYFGNLGGEGHKIPPPIGSLLEEHFGSATAWRRDFVGTAQSLAGGSGWTLLSYSRRDRRLWNQIAFDHTQAAVDAAPVLALDMYEHAYHLDFGANATAYIDAFAPTARSLRRTPPTRPCRRSPSRSSPHSSPRVSPSRCWTRGRGITSRARST